MIIDSIGNTEKYFKMHSRFADAFEFLKRDDLKKLPSGRIDLDGDNLYALISNAPGRNRAGALLETHRCYADIQFILEGKETFGWASKEECCYVSVPYDKNKDIEFYQDEPRVWFDLSPGMFVIFNPGEGHLPGVSSGTVHKVVLKVKQENID